MGVSVFEGVAAPGGISSDTVSVDGLTGGVDAIFLPQPLSFLPLREDLRLDFGTGSATITRSTIGTFEDKDDGLVKTAAIDAARFEQNGILIEGASTNEALRNRDFTNAVHVKTNITAAKDATGADGIVNAASTLTATAANGTVFQTITKASAQNTFSIDVRRKTGTGTIEITDDGGSTFTDITASVNSVSYARFSITTTQANPSIGLRIVTSGDEVEVDYEGLEVLPFASSRIETAGSPVTRTADNLSIDAANLPATQPLSLFYNGDTLGAVGGSVRQYGMLADDASASNRLNIRHIDNASGELRAVYGSTATNQDLVGGTLFDGKVAVVLSDTEGKLYLGGSVVDTRPADPDLDTTLYSNIQIGTGLFGHIKDFRIYDVALTDAQVGAL